MRFSCSLNKAATKALFIISKKKRIPRTITVIVLPGGINWVSMGNKNNEFAEKPILT